MIHMQAWMRIANFAQIKIRVKQRKQKQLDTQVQLISPWFALQRYT